MGIIVSCACGQNFQARDDMAGRLAKCPACGKTLTIAAGKAPTQSARTQATSSAAGRASNAPTTKAPASKAPTTKAPPPKAPPPKPAAKESSLEDLLKMASATGAIGPARPPGSPGPQGAGMQPGMGMGMGMQPGMGMGMQPGMGMGMQTPTYNPALAMMAPRPQSSGGGNKIFLIGGIIIGVLLLVGIGIVVVTLTMGGSDPQPIASNNGTTRPPPPAGGVQPAGTLPAGTSPAGSNPPGAGTAPGSVPGAAPAGGMDGVADLIGMDPKQTSFGTFGAWTNFTAGNVQVQLPGTPHQMDVELHGQKVSLVLLGTKGAMNYVFMRTQVPASLAADLIEQSLVMLRAIKGVQILRSDDVVLDTLKGKEVVAEITENNKKHRAHLRVFAGGDHIYRLTVVSEAPTFSEADCLKCLNSLRIGAPGSTPSGGTSGGETIALKSALLKWHHGGQQLIGLRPGKEEGDTFAWGWMAELLPHLEHGDLYNKIDFKLHPQDPKNSEVSHTIITQFTNPADKNVRWSALQGNGLALSHFVGISGVEDKGNDVAARFPRSDPRAGVFGYDAVATPGEITDGTSQTIMIAGSGRLATPWVFGGGTIRGARSLPNGKPAYFDPVLGFGSKGIPGGGVYVVMADGSVRVIKSNVDPKLFRAMCTTHGKETVDAGVLGPELSDFLEK